MEVDDTSIGEVNVTFCTVVEGVILSELSSVAPAARLVKELVVEGSIVLVMVELEGCGVVTCVVVRTWAGVFGMKTSVATTNRSRRVRVDCESFNL